MRKHPWRSPLVLLLAGGLVASPILAVAPANKRPKSQTTSNGPNARGRGDRDAQARLQAAPLEMRMNARKLQLDILHSNPSFPALRQEIAAARTDEIKRAAWDRYYVTLYGEMRRRKPEYTEYIGLLEKVVRSRYDPPHRRGEAVDSAGFDRAEL